MKIFTFLTLFLTCLSGLNSQTPSFQITEHGNNNQVANNSIYTHTTAPLSSETTILDLKNVTNSAQTYNFFKTEYQMHKVAPGDSSFAYFCTGIYCYGSTTYSAAVTLSVGELMAVRFDMDEATTVGYSLVGYKMVNAANSSETFSVVMKYNSPTSIIERSGMTVKSMKIFPNPSASNPMLTLHSATKSNVHINLINALGEVVLRQEETLIVGENTINLTTENLNSGIYFLNLKQGNEGRTIKLIVEK